MPSSPFRVDVDLSKGCPSPGGVVVLAFPTVGQAGPIAAHFLVRTLDLQPSGGVYGPGFGALARVDNGRVVPLVRAFCASLTCKPQGGCEGLTVLVADLAVAPERQYELARTLLEWVEETQAGLTVVLEGVNLAGSRAEFFGAATSGEVETLLAENEIPALESGALGGVGAAFLEQAAERGVPAAAVLAPAETGQASDPAAASNLLKVIDRLLVDVRVDPEPLLEESERVQQARTRAAELPLYS